MTPDEAEAKIVELVKSIDATREDASLAQHEKDQRIAAFDAKIREIKRITGPRKIVGEMHLGSPDA